MFNHKPKKANRQKSSLRHINRFISLDNNAALPQRLKYQNNLLKYIRGLLPDLLKKHCLAAVQRDQEFTLFTDTSAWASRLRFFSRDLLNQLRLTYPATNKVNIRVMHQYHTSAIQSNSHHPLTLTQKNARLIQQTAEHISDHNLKSALQRLAQHQNNKH